jgi:nucleotide sugar dehydrogenase
MLIGVIGNGFVGKATKHLSCSDIELLVYDINPKLCEPLNTKLEDLEKCDIIFISVPTPMKKNGECFLGIVESVVNDINTKMSNPPFIVIRSTVPPGTSEKLGCYFMPEFLTEKNFINDFINNKNWIFGVKNSEDNINFKNKIIKLFNLSHKNKKILHNNIHFIKNSEAEMVKYFRNCFLSTKVSFCNEVEEFCGKKNIDYNVVRKFGGIDPRIGQSHTMVPGHDGKRGFGGTCFPKDTSALRHEMNKMGMKSYVIDSIIERNNNVDRNEQDWNDNKGRAVVD